MQDVEHKPTRQITLASTRRIYVYIFKCNIINYAQ